MKKFLSIVLAGNLLAGQALAGQIVNFGNLANMKVQFDAAPRAVAASAVTSGKVSKASRFWMGVGATSLVGATIGGVGYKRANYRHSGIPVLAFVPAMGLLGGVFGSIGADRQMAFEKQSGWISVGVPTAVSAGLVAAFGLYVSRGDGAVGRSIALGGAAGSFAFIGALISKELQ